MKLRGWRLFFAWLLLGALVAIDFFIKEWALHHLTPINSAIFPYGGIPILHNFLGIDFSLNLVFNHGMAYGFMSSQAKLLLAIRVALIAFLSLHLLFWNNKPRTQFPWVLILAGASANILDVIRLGYVVDLFYFKFLGVAPFAIFNLADFCISVGILFIILHSYLVKRNDSRTLKT